MKVSVITIVYNNKLFIRDAVNSVKPQSYENIEHIVIDGGSTDGTVEHLEQFRPHIDTFISEPDKGIYDAMNKGIANSTGDIIGFLHSDDVYMHDEVIKTVVEAFEESGADVVYSDLVYVSRHDEDKVLRYWKAGEFSRAKLKFGWMPPHPTMFIRRSVYDSIGPYNANLRISADYDMVLRLFQQPDIRVVYIPEVLVRMRLGGASNRSIRNLLRKSREDFFAIRRHGIGSIFTVGLKMLIKLPQFLHKELPGGSKPNNTRKP